MGKGTSFVIGAAIGAVAALLLSPNTGERNREVVAEKFGYYSSHGGEVFQNAAGTVRDKAGDVRDRVRGAGAGSSESAEDIKRKINEARDRIAEQVTRNRAAQDAEAADEPIDEEHAGFVESEPEEPAAE